MDISTLLKKLKVSKFVVFWKSLFGGKSSVADYLLDKANTAVAALPGQSKQNLAKLYDRLLKIRNLLEDLDWIVPSGWVKYYAAVMRAYNVTLDVLADGKVDMPEITHATEQFKIAYATWKADDVEPEVEK